MRRRRPAGRGYAPQTRRVARALRLLAAGPVTVRDLAAHLGVEVRTAWRLVAALRAELLLEEGLDGRRRTVRLRGRWWA